MKPTRRQFAGAVIVTTAAACGSKKKEYEGVNPPGPEVPKTPDAAVAGPEPIPHPELEELTLAQLAEKLAGKTETAKSLVEKYGKRIEATNERGPKLRAVLEVSAGAAARAAELDAMARPAGRLHGLPILVKDNIDTADIPTTAGSLALEGKPAKDAFVVARLREAGAVVLGKTNLSEWANFRGTASVSGWSARGGQCRNPYALDRSPSGSSSGSAVAVAASLCAAALGTETDGSIVSPSSCNGLVGLKPTVGLVSRAGVVPLSTSQDTVGPMARSVADAALLLTVIAGPDPADPATQVAHRDRPQPGFDYTKVLDPKALAGARIGVPREGFFGNNRNVDALMTGALKKLTELGAILVDPADLKIAPEVGGAEIDVFLYEMKEALTKYLAGRDGKVRSLADAIAFNQQHADRELRIFGQEFFERAAEKAGLDDKAYTEARAKCLAGTREVIDAAIAQHKLDAFVAATSGPAWLIDPIIGDAGGGVSCSGPPAVAGYPHVTVPAGDYLGLPVGLSFFGGAFSEAKLLAYAYAWEQATKARKPPRYLATAQIPT